MFKKLKANFFNKNRKLSAVLVLLLIGSVFLTPTIVKAADESNGAGCTGDRTTSQQDGRRICQLNHIELTIDTYVDVDGTGNFVKGNLVKMGPNDTATIKAVISLSSPSDLKVSSGVLGTGYGTGADWVYVPGVAADDAPIVGFGVTVTPQDTTNYCMRESTSWFGTYDKCENDTGAGGRNIPFVRWFYTSSGTNFQGFVTPSSLTTYAANTPVFTKVIKITSQDFASLGITHIYDSTANNQGLNQITIYPDLGFGTSLSQSDWTSYIHGGANVFIQRYASAADKQNYSAAPPVCTGNPNNGTSTAPSCVPTYGTVTSSGSNINGNQLVGIFALLAKVVAFFVHLAQELIYNVFDLLLLPLLSGLLNIHPYTDTFVGVIYPGWVIVRNACNILFIISILAIAMGTLFRVDSYQYKHLLVQLILAALLVNFSLVIAQAVLGLADTVQNQFLPNSPLVIRSLGTILIQSHTTQDDWANLLINTGGAFSGVIAPLFGLALALGTFCVFAALVVFLAIRIVALWIFLMISPIAYVGGVLPQTAKWRDQWWENFIHYAFFTPIIAFFLNIAARLVDAQNKNPILQNISDTVNRDTNLQNAPSLATFMFSVGSNILLLIFLFAAMQVAEQLGIYGGHAVSGMGKKVLMAPFAIAGGGVKLGAGKLKQVYDEKTLGLAGSKSVFGKAAYAVMHAPSFFHAIGTDSKKEQEKVKHLTEAAALKIKRLTPIVKREGRDPLYHAILEQGEERLNEVYGHYTGNETEEVRRLVELEKKAMAGDKKAGMMLMAQMLRAAPNKHVNQFMDDKGLDYTQANLIGMLDDWEEKGIMSHTINEEFQTALSEQGYKISDFTLTELSDGKNAIHVEKDPTTGQYRVVGEKEWTAYNEWVRNYAETNGFTQPQFKALQKGMLKDPAFSAQRAAFLAANPGFDEHAYENANLRQQQIMKRDVNASKLERKFSIFHNSLGTTDASLGLNAEGDRKQVFGESGNYVLTHLSNTDVWGASRGQLTDKQKKRLYAMLKDHGLAGLKDMVEKEYRQELARDGLYKTTAEIKDMVDRKTRYIVSIGYASKTNEGTGPIATKFIGSGAKPEDLEIGLTDTAMQEMIDTTIR